MELFEDLTLRVCAPRPLIIATPLGAITSSAAVDSYSLTSDNSKYFYTLEFGGFAAHWELPSGVVEVIISRPSLIREYWAGVTDCWAFLWRFKALQPIEKLVFESSWMSGYTWTGGGSDSGQWLSAQTWDDGNQNTVSLGTEGDDTLFVRAGENDWLPERFIHQSINGWSLPLVHYLDEGLSVDFGEVLPGELFQAHFAVAWSPYDEESIGTGNAVQLCAEHITDGAAGRTGWQPKND